MRLAPDTDWGWLPRTAGRVKRGAANWRPTTPRIRNAADLYQRALSVLAGIEGKRETRAIHPGHRLSQRPDDCPDGRLAEATEMVRIMIDRVALTPSSAPAGRASIFWCVATAITAATRR